ncbi:MAG: hypothetical protein VX370_03570 [Bacteroidota bacterium]|nr:hypothetical protein [Bacteroidota bacterium]
MKKTLNLLIILSLVFFSCSKDDESSDSINITASQLYGTSGERTWEADSWKLNGTELISEVAFAQTYYDDNSVFTAAANSLGCVAYTADSYECSGNTITYTSLDAATLGQTSQVTVTKITSNEFDITFNDAGDTHEIKMYRYSGMTDNNIREKAFEQENNLSFREVLNKIKELKTE